MKTRSLEIKGEVAKADSLPVAAGTFPVDAAGCPEVLLVQFRDWPRAPGNLNTRCSRARFPGAEVVPRFT